MTWAEVGEQLGMHHGSASSALAHLQREGVIVRLRTRRARSSVYVAPMYADPEDIAVPRASASSKEAVSDAYDKGWQSGYDQGLEAGRRYSARADVLDQYRREGAASERRRLLAVATSMLHTIDPQAATVTHRGDCWRVHPPCAVRAFRRGLLIADAA